MLNVHDVIISVAIGIVSNSAFIRIPVCLKKIDVFQDEEFVLIGLCILPHR